jgi:plasmid maintenance system antidote protein VapI
MLRGSMTTTTKSAHDISTTDAVRSPRSLREYLKGPPQHSQRQLAKRAGCNQAMISMLVRGTRRPRAALALTLHKITGVPLEALLAPRRRRHKKKKKTPTAAPFCWSPLTKLTKTESADAYDADDACTADALAD